MEFLQGAAKAKYQRYLGVTRLARFCPEVLPLFKNVNDKVAKSDSAAVKSSLSIAHLSSVFILHSEKQNALFVIENAAGHTKHNKKENRKDTPSSSRAFRS